MDAATVAKRLDLMADYFKQRQNPHQPALTVLNPIIMEETARDAAEIVRREIKRERDIQCE